MFQIRIHGRGGQGVVSGAEMLSVAAFLEGRYAQAFPSFGSERMGAPVMAFCRIDDKEIRMREPVLAARRIDHPGPDTPAPGRSVQWPARTRVHRPQLDKTLDELGLGGFARGVQQYRLCTLPATELALKHVGRPVPNAALLGGFAAITGVITLASVLAAIRQKFPAAVAEKNVAAATEAFAIASKARETVDA